MTMPDFDPRRVLSIVTSLEAHFVVVDFHLGGVNVEDVLALRGHIDRPLAVIGLAQPATEEWDAITDLGLDAVFTLPITEAVIERIKGDLPPAIDAVIADWGRGAWDVAPDMIRQASKAAGGASWERQAIAVYSPKGGVGKTTIAVELAVMLSSVGGRNVVLVDANMNGGHSHIRLGYPVPKRNITDVANVYQMRGGNGNHDAIILAFASDNVLLNVAGKGSLKLLPGIDNQNEASHAAIRREQGYDFIKAAVAYLRRQFDYVVLDLGSSINVGVHRGALEQADSVLLVADSGISSLNDARHAAKIIEKDKLNDKVYLVMNNWLDGVALSLKAAHDHTGITVAGFVPFDTSGNVTYAENQGQSYVAMYSAQKSLPHSTQQTLTGIAEVATLFYPPIGDVWRARRTDVKKKKKRLFGLNLGKRDQ